MTPIPELPSPPSKPTMLGSAVGFADKAAARTHFEEYGFALADETDTYIRMTSQGRKFEAYAEAANGTWRGYMAQLPTT